MREILFRAKSIRNGEWKYGNLFVGENNEHQICIGTPRIRITYDIDIETVGQYTGLKDKNGKNIYEGDIVKIKTRIGSISLKHGAFCFEEKDISSEDRFCPLVDALSLDGFEIEIVGNIHDNPELLKGDEK